LGSKTIDLSEQVAKAGYLLILLAILGSVLACAPTPSVSPLPAPTDDLAATFAAKVKPLLAEQRYAEAVALLEQTARARPNDPIPLRQIGQIYLFQQRWRLAEDAFNRALARDLANAETMTDLGESLLNQGRLDEALKWQRQAADRQPDLPGVFTGLGQTYLLLFDIEASRSAFEQQQSHTFDPDAAWYLAALTAPTNLAAAQSHLRAIPDNAPSVLLARRDYLRNTLASFTPESPPAQVAKATGVALAQLGLWPAAIYALNTALEQNGSPLSQRERADTLAFLGYASAQVGRPAFNLLEQAIHTDPQAVLPLYFEGRYLRQKGALKAAEALFTQALTLDPKNAALYAELADLIAEQGNLGGAEVLYTAASKVAPNDLSFQLLLLKFYADRGYRVKDVGLPLAETVLQTYPDNAEVYASLGWIQFLAGKTDHGEKSLQRALELDPKLVSAHYHLARVLEAKSAPVSAAEEYRRVVDLDTSSGTWRDQALKDLRRLGEK
jgi:tetratricopeptide (TPR) repeat protein